MHINATALLECPEYKCPSLPPQILQALAPRDPRKPTPLQSTLLWVLHEVLGDKAKWRISVDTIYGWQLSEHDISPKRGQNSLQLPPWCQQARDISFPGLQARVPYGPEVADLPEPFCQCPLTAPTNLLSQPQNPLRHRPRVPCRAGTTSNARLGLWWVLG